MHDPKTLTLHCLPVLEGTNDIIATIVAHNGGQCCDYGWMPLQSPVIAQDTRPKIVDALLMLIFKMGEGACHLPFEL